MWSNASPGSRCRSAETITDTDGKSRTQLRVTKAADAYMEILDAQGNVAFRAPQATASKTR